MTNVYARYKVSEETYSKIEHWYQMLENNENPAKQKEILAELIYILTKEGMDYFFQQSLERIGVGAIIKNMVNIGLMPVLKTVKAIARKATNKMNEQQIKETAVFFKEFLTPEPQKNTE